MANKTYNVTQYVNYNGVQKKVSFSVDMAESELTAFIALLEGGVKVTEQNDTLTNLSAKDTLVTAVNSVGNIRLVATAPNGKYLSKSIKPFSGQIMFKSTAGLADIEAVLKTTSPFWEAPAEKPSNVKFDGTSHDTEVE